VKTLPVIGLPLACTTYAGAVEWIKARAVEHGTFALEAANTHVAALSRSDAAFGQAMSRFDLIVPDGMPLVWSLNTKLPDGEKLTDRVYGPTLMLETLRGTQGQPEFRHFFLGGKESTLEKLHARFAEEFPETVIAGSHSPPFGEWTEAEFDKICQKIKDSGANLIWVCFGCPKQELWIARHKERLPPGVYFGIGAAFAFHAGEVSQAPAILQRIGMEWAYRIAAEPRRLFKRYFTYNSLFLWYSLLDRLRGA
jgi:N-acetylglucosaminyldiphosphoundecaprenol N-acetyl-beta-D-mannosaminyltransferase